MLKFLHGNIPHESKPIRKLAYPIHFISVGSDGSIDGCCLQESAWRRDFYGNDAATAAAAASSARHLRLMHANNPHAFPAIFQSIVHFPLSGLTDEARRVAARPEARILVYWGDSDAVVPTRDLARWRAALTGPGARARTEVEVMPAAGHAFFLQQPAAAAARILRFLAPDA